MRSLQLFLICLATFVSPLGAAEPLKLPVTRDAWISAFPGEQEGNNGSAPRLKFKGIQEFSLLDFDTAALRGKKVARAELWVHLESPDAPLGRMTVSTVAAPWDEGAGSGYATGVGASFRWAAPNRTWNGPGSDVTSVVNSEAGTVWGFGDASPPDAKGWQAIPVEPAVIEACAAGSSHGVFVQDDVGSEYVRDGEKFTWKLFPNRFVASRDMNKSVAPYFLIWVSSGKPNATTLPKLPGRSPEPRGELPAGSELPGTKSASNLLTNLAGTPIGDELCSAKNETIAFFIAREPGEKVELESRNCSTRLYGLEKDVLIPSTDQGRVLGEIHVTHTCQAGMHSIKLRVGQRNFEIPLRVWDFTLPNHLSFVPEMNAYGLPVPPEQEVAWYRLAHEHRLNLNVLRYGWNGRVADGAAPSKQGNTWNWKEWDTRFGPLLDGSAFQNLPRAGVPVDAFYLPINEHWPADVHRYFQGGYWIENAFPDSYWNEFADASKEFAVHARDRGWTKPWLQFYLNNKIYFKEQRGHWSSCSAPWIFDEPVSTQDFWALRRYGQEFNRATRAIATNAIFRCDVSRPEWQRDLLNGVTGVEVIGGAIRPYRDRIMRRQARYGTIVSFYGTTAAPTDFPVQPAAWCLDAWCLGADGVLPWQTIGSVESWNKPDQLSLFYPARNLADPSVSPSLRLKSYREGQQLVEYLTWYVQITGQTRQAVEKAVTEFLGLNPELKKKNNDDAGTLEYQPNISQKLVELRNRLGKFLDSKHPVAQEKLIEWKIQTEEVPRQIVKSGP